ncbi:aldehyde dehydrogenase, partial [Streptomyces sp. NPDC001868]
MGSTQLSRTISRRRPQHGRRRNPARLRTYQSYVDGQEVAGDDWVYVLDADSLLDDVFANLTLKRKLEQGRLAPDELPATVVGRVAKADRATVERAVEAAAAAST